MRPRVHHAHTGVRRGQLLRRDGLRDAARQAPQPLGGLGIVGAAAVVQDAHPRALLRRIPLVLGDLQVPEPGAVGALLRGLEQVLELEGDTLHVVERFRVDTDNNTLAREYVASDPAFLQSHFTGEQVMRLLGEPYTPYDCTELSGDNNGRPIQ